MSGVSPAGEKDRIAVWDLPTRLFHWLLVVLLVSAYATRNYLDDPTLYWHRINGYAVLSLLLFRVFWGFAGSSTSRFGAFLPTPATVYRYGTGLLSGRRLHYLGHNPLGSLLIFGMLIALAAQAGTGLFTSDETIAQGPLHDHAPDWVTSAAESYHAKGFWIIAALVAVHVAANLIYQFGFKDRLITAMVTGAKPAGVFVDAQESQAASIGRACICFAVAVAVVAAGVVVSGDSLLR
jgi:cytochrome b